MKRRVFGFHFSEVKLAEGDNPSGSHSGWVELLREGNYKHKMLGTIPVTRALLASLKTNFDKKVRGIDVATDYYHEWMKDASGWIMEVEVRLGEDDKEALWVRPEWTPRATIKLEDKELKYISADFDFNFEDNETGAKHGPTLLGAGLTNRPHVKRMQALLSESDDMTEEEMKTYFPEYKGDDSMDFETLLEALSGLTEDQKAQVAQKLGIKVAAKEEEKPASLESDNAELSEKNAEIAKLKKQIETDSKKAEFNVMLSEGTVVEAQREHFMKGDMAAFVKASVEVNLNEDGGVGTGTDNVTDPKAKKGEDKLDKAGAESKLSELTDELCEKSPELDYGTAMSTVIESNPELAKLAEA